MGSNGIVVDGEPFDGLNVIGHPVPTSAPERVGVKVVPAWRSHRTLIVHPLLVFLTLPFPVWNEPVEGTARA